MSIIINWDQVSTQNGGSIFIIIIIIIITTIILDVWGYLISLQSGSKDVCCLGEPSSIGIVGSSNTEGCENQPK